MNCSRAPNCKGILGGTNWIGVSGHSFALICSKCRMLHDTDRSPLSISVVTSGREAIHNQVFLKKGKIVFKD